MPGRVAIVSNNQKWDTEDVAYDVSQWDSLDIEVA